MPIIQPRNVAMVDGKFEVSPFRGTADDAAEFKVKRLDDLDDGTNARTYFIGNRRVFVGDVFRRRVGKWNGTDWAERATEWQHLSHQNYLDRDPDLINPDREVAAPAGQPMRDPAGIRIFLDEDGDGIGDDTPAAGIVTAVVNGGPLQPASTEQARDQWTGKLMFEADGVTPILVP